MKQVLKKSVAFTLIVALCFTLMAAFATMEVQAASKTHFKYSSITLTAGMTYAQYLLTQNNKRINATKIKWTSNNNNIAKVDKWGSVTGIKKGKTTIKAKYKGKTYSFKVTVLKPTVVVRYNVTGEEVNTIPVGESNYIAWLDGRLSNEIINSKKLSYYSSDTDIFTVDKDGELMGISEGTATLYITCLGVKYSKKIHVVNGSSTENPIENSKGSVTCITPLPCVCDGIYGTILRVDAVTGEVDRDGSLMLNFEITCTGILGNKTSAGGCIKYKIYDSEGFVVGTGSISMSNIAVGDRMKKRNLNYFGKQIDDYTIEITNTIL